MKKKLITLLLTLAILAFLFYKVGVQELGAALRQTDMLLFSLAFVMFVPQLAIIAARWKMLCKTFATIDFWDSLQMILASQTLNLFLPSKAGDFAKAAFLVRRNAQLKYSQTIGLVVFEKLLDIASFALYFSVIYYLAIFLGLRFHYKTQLALPVFALAGGALAFFASCVFTGKVSALFERMAGRNTSSKIAGFLRSLLVIMYALRLSGRSGRRILFLSLLLWFTHLLQIWLFFMSMQTALVEMPPTTLIIIGASTAIFIGLIPLTIAGFGTRDAALLLLFPLCAKSGILAVALFINLRYIVPALCGIPFIGNLMTKHEDI